MRPSARPTRQLSPFLPPPCRPSPGFDDHRRRPVHVVERQPGVRERLLPGRALVGLLAGLDPLHGLREVCLGAAELDAAGVALVARQALLQRRLDHPLQLRVDGRAHRVGVGGDRLDAGRRLGLAGDLVDEVEADVAARLVGGERRQCRQSLAVLLGHGDAVLLQAAEHIGEPLLRPPRMAVGTVVVRPFGQPGQQRALFERERPSPACRNSCCAAISIPQAPRPRKTKLR